MKAIEKKIKIPVYNNTVLYPGGTASMPKDPPDRYIDGVILHCPLCGCMLSQDVTAPGKYYCWSCKAYGIEAP